MVVGDEAVEQLAINIKRSSFSVGHGFVQIGLLSNSMVP